MAESNGSVRPSATDLPVGKTTRPRPCHSRLTDAGYKRHGFLRRFASRLPSPTACTYPQNSVYLYLQAAFGVGPTVKRRKELESPFFCAIPGHSEGRSPTESYRAGRNAIARRWPPFPVPGGGDGRAGQPDILGTEITQSEPATQKSAINEAGELWPSSFIRKGTTQSSCSRI